MAEIAASAAAMIPTQREISALGWSPGPRTKMPAAIRIMPTISQELCDRCHAAWAKVEVITSAGSVFFCQHHHKKYRHSVIAAGHQIRAVLGRAISGHRARELGAGGHAGLPEHLPQVIVDGGRAEEQLRGDVPVALALADQPGDLRLLRRELIFGPDDPLPGAFPGREELDAGPFG